MKEYQIYISWGNSDHIFRCDVVYILKNNLAVDEITKRILTDEAIADIVKYGFKSVTIREGYYIDIVVG